MLRGAVIGVGNVATRGHLPAWSRREDVSIVAAADPRMEGRAIFARQAPRARWYDSADALFEAERLDFVDVCTPPAFHAEAIRVALERGIHVLCEKPLVLSHDELWELSALARERDRALVTVHNWRYAPILARATQLLRDGAAGTLRHARWETLRDQPAAAAGTENWRVDPSIAGGGILIDHGWHALYMISEWLPTEPKRISARLETRHHRDWPIEDTAALTLEFGTARVEVFLTWTAGERANRVSLEGREATITVDGRVLEVRPHFGRPSQQEHFSSSLTEGSHHADWFEAVVEEFLGEVGDRAYRGRSLAQAQHCLNWIRAAQDSSRRGGEPVLVPSSKAEPLEAAR